MHKKELMVELVFKENLYFEKCDGLFQKNTLGLKIQ